MLNAAWLSAVPAAPAAESWLSLMLRCRLAPALAPPAMVNDTTAALVARPKSAVKVPP
jgi:hypothetical protein